MKKSLFTDYDGFVEKFKPKKTTDDCYTPSAVYDVVLNYVSDRVDLTGKRILRPFYPGGDFENEDYTNAVVIDNPPFSIMARILRFYKQRKIPYFLFAPSLTMFSSYTGAETYIIASAQVVYDNGAVVRTSFVTNMWGDDLIIVDGDLRTEIESSIAKVSTRLPKSRYPDNIAIAAHLGKLAKPGVTMKIPRSAAVYIRKMDYQGGKAIFGSGFILNTKAAAEKAAAEKAAAEKAAAEKAIEFKLSPRELRIIEELDKMTQ